MSPKISFIREILHSDTDVSLHRYVFILAGSDVWQNEILSTTLLGNENDALWLGKSAIEKITSLPFNKAKTWLGNEKRIVIFDANKSFDVDSFAAISGIVLGGGILFLLLPERKIWKDIYFSYFGQRFRQKIESFKECHVLEEINDELGFIPHQSTQNKIKDCSAPYLTYDQQHSVELIAETTLSLKNTPIVLMSSRGRGKSAALGFTVAKLLKAGLKNIAVTAPRLTATNIIFKHIEEMLPESVISKGCIKYKNCSVQFYSPDRLIQEEIEADILFIDEAAAIPIPLLSSFLKNYTQCVFSTTVHGYEGTGRGFSLRFFEELDKHDESWLKLQMQTPIRWAENDPLENWMFDLLCLDAEILDEHIINQVNLSDIKYCLISKEDFLEDSLLLREIFSLLVLAHYRTRPKDLVSMLDDENISIYVALYKNHAVAVSLVIREGAFSSSLSTQVYRGERRPIGNLLAQTLTYHCGIESAATLKYSRIMRVAVHPSIQHNGIGTALVRFIIDDVKEKQHDAIGTSFGMNNELLDFWMKSKFDLVRIGFTREKTSGEHAAVMLLGLSSKGEAVLQEAISRFKDQLPFWLDDVLQDLPENVKEKFCASNKIDYDFTDYNKKDLQSYINYSRNYELCIAALNKFISKKYESISKTDFPEKFYYVIEQKITLKKNWSDTANELALSGKGAARSLLHEAITELSNQITL